MTLKTGKTVRMLVVVALFTAICFHSNSQDLKEIRHKADKAIKREQFKEAIPLLKALLARDSSSSEIFFDLALAMYNTEDFSGCVTYSTRGIEVDSTYAAHHFRRGQCYSRLNDYQAAIRDYTKAIELEPKHFSYFNRATARWKSGDANGGIADFTTALDFKPKDADAFYYRALCYEEVGDTIKAMVDLDKSIALKPKDPDIYDERAYNRFLRENYSGAKADYLQCLELDPAYVKAHLSLSEISLIAGEWLAAYQHASNAVLYSSDPDERVVGLLFKCAANKLMDKNTSDDEAVLNSALINLAETSWEFEAWQQALGKQNVSAEKQLYINLLITNYYESGIN
jgi:tetratricopeptide (TPR) repeat protein